MSQINEVKEQMLVVKSVGDFANALQQIASMRMNINRKKVLAGREFVETTEVILKELKEIQEIRRHLLLNMSRKSDKKKNNKNIPATNRSAVIVVTSDQGLNGKYNYDIYQKIQDISNNINNEYPGFNDADYYIIGKKGQEYFKLGKIKVKYYPYILKENFVEDDLSNLSRLFNFYNKVIFVYTKFINPAVREVKVVSLVTPPEILIKDTNVYKDKEIKKEINKTPKVQVGYIGEDIKYIFEPSLEDLIIELSEVLRSAYLRQEILDARLAHYSAQMIGMKAASDNAIDLSKDLLHEYNKQRRKLIDKKIGEIFAGINLW